jgi:dienelactone hydrolase
MRDETLLLALSLAHSLAMNATSQAVQTPDHSQGLDREMVVCRQEIRTNVVGDFYVAANSMSLPAIILLGGSDGEPMQKRSELLASKGYAVLNLFYFGHDLLPKHFAKVPIEYLTDAVSWLQARQQVDPTRIGVIGYSRGTEAAFLMATLCPGVKAVVGVAPSSVVWPGPGASGYFHSAWSLNGNELPYVPVKFLKGFGVFLKEISGRTQIEHRPLFEDALKNQPAVERATIQVEKIKAPVLLISGKDDRVWPSALMAEMIATRLRQNQHPYRFQHLSYENAGHSFGLPGMRGTAAGNAQAAAQSWLAMLEFLGRELAVSK